jgi:hypothetical protein
MHHFMTEFSTNLLKLRQWQYVSQKCITLLGPALNTLMDAIIKQSSLLVSKPHMHCLLQLMANGKTMAC